jgi:hypothetical protein
MDNEFWSIFSKVTKWSPAIPSFGQLNRNLVRKTVWQEWLANFVINSDNLRLRKPLGRKDERAGHVGWVK